MLKSPLYLVCVSDWGEPESVVRFLNFYRPSFDEKMILMRGLVAGAVEDSYGIPIFTSIKCRYFQSITSYFS